MSVRYKTHSVRPPGINPICHRQLKVDPPTGEKRSLLIVILLVLPTDFWTRPIGFLFS